MKAKTKTVSIYIPDEIALNKALKIPAFQRLTKIKLQIGSNIEVVNHKCYADMIRLYPTIGINVKEIKAG